MMFIGIDPGPRECCAVMFDGDNVVCVQNLPTRELATWVATEREMFKVGVACEWIASYGMPVGAEVFETCGNIGILVASIPDMRLIPRADIKLHLCHSARAKDGNVRQALIDLLGPVGTKKQPGPCYGVSKHAWAALAVAVTAASIPRTNREATWHKQTA